MISLRSLSILAITASMLGTYSASAQIITWGAVQKMQGPGDISTDGTYLDAVAANTINGDNPTVGDTTFNNLSSEFGESAYANPDHPPGNLLTDKTALKTNWISITADNLANYGPGNEFSTSSDAYQDAISFGLYIGSSSEVGTITLGGLTAGDYYQVEVWSNYNDDRFNPLLSGASPSSDDPTLDNGAGQYVIGTFQASDTTFSFDYTANATSGTPGNDNVGAVINDVALREVPEPSTWLLMGLGAVMVGWSVRRRRLA